MAKIAGYFLLFLLIAIVFDAVTGFSSIMASPVLPTFQTGTAQCNTSSPGLSEGFGCRGTITFPKRFASGPTAYGITIVCWSNTAQILTNNASKVCDGLGSQIGHLVNTAGAPSVFNIVTGPTTWTNMPAASTPLFGTDAYDIQLDTNSLGSVSPTATITIGFAFICENPSNQPNAFLGIQYSPDFSVWTDFSTALHTGIGSNGVSLCPFGTPGSPLPTGLVSTTTTPAFLINNPNIRVFGSGGGGIGDVPQFSSMVFFLDIGQPSNPVANIGYPQGDNGHDVTTSSMPFYVLLPSAPAGFGNPIMQWWACTC